MTACEDARAMTHVPTPSAAAAAITMDCRRTMDLARCSSSASMARWVACCLRLSRSCTQQSLQLSTTQCTDLCRKICCRGMTHFCTDRLLHRQASAQMGRRASSLHTDRPLHRQTCALTVNRFLHGHAASFCTTSLDICRDLLQASAKTSYSRLQRNVYSLWQRPLYRFLQGLLQGACTEFCIELTST